MQTYLPHEAIIIERIDESATIFTLRLQFTDPEIHNNFKFSPGQFNMLYLYGVGEIAISIVSDPEDETLYDHTIRVVGRVTKGFARLKQGDRIGVRGPYGNGWPLSENTGKDILVITGGLGCAPAVSVINYIFKRREQYGTLYILQGVKHSDDLIYQKRYRQWAKHPNTQVLITADKTTKKWPWYQGNVITLLDKININSNGIAAMLCGPEIMLYYAALELKKRNIAEERIYLSMERNMQCGVGTCGHCQYGGLFICKDGPVLSYDKVKDLFLVEGY